MFEKFQHNINIAEASIFYFSPWWCVTTPLAPFEYAHDITAFGAGKDH